MAKILIVENDSDIGPLIRQLLTLAGHQPTLIADPTAAMAALREEKPDLIYLDVRLTDQMDGFAVMRQIRAESDVPAIMSSGLDLERECLQAGADAFLMKPFDFASLLDSITRTLSARQSPAAPRGGGH